MTEKKTKGRPRSFDKDAALEIAMHLFWRQGYEGTSLGQLTSEMGIAAPSLYAAFGSKEALFRLALDRYFQSQSSQADAILAQSPTAKGAVEEILQASAQAFSDPASPLGCMIGIGALQCGLDNDAIGQATLILRGRSYDALLARLKLAQSSGEIDPSQDVIALADYYSGVVYGLSVLAADSAPRARLIATADLAMKAWPA